MRKLVKVSILGGAGGIGQPLALMLMQHPDQIQHLALHDLADSIHGVGLDLSHVDKQCRVTTHLGHEELAQAVKGSQVIVVLAGLAQKPGMSRDDLFGSNAKIMYNLAKTCAQVAPEAMLAIVSNPVNSLVPIACEVYRLYSGSSKRVFGVTTLDVVRASTLLAKSVFFKSDPSGLFKDPSKVQVPVVGGHAGKTIMPILSQARPRLDPKRLQDELTTTLTLIESIQQAGIEVLNMKKGRGSATLAMAHAARRFTLSLLRAQQGEQNVIECAYVRHSSPIYDDLEYFAAPLLLGKNGWVKAVGLESAGKLLPFEHKMLEEGARELRLSIAKGDDFVRENTSRSE